MQETLSIEQQLAEAQSRIRELQDQLKLAEGHKQEPLAIIGVGCRYPGDVQSLDDLWKLLLNKTDAITNYPESRNSNVAALVDQNREAHKIITQRGGYIRDLEYFDAGFFNISPAEAEKIDPAQRLLLEVTQEAVENAGLTAEELQGTNTGVFAGNWTSDYEHRLEKANQDIDVYATTGSGRYALSGRLSYFYNLQGPSLTVDTACSSSIVALNIAFQSLNNKECDLAFIGASNTITDFFVTIGYSRSGLLSEYGQCRFGDERTTGYVRSEGAATIIVKRLSDALRDGNRIHAVVLSTACNSDGQSHKNLFAPSATTQELMIRQAITRAGVDPKDLIYIEAHGTGTKAGDPTEVKSIWNAVSDNRSKDDVIYAGSLKTNFGHTEAAAGLAGLLKSVVSLQHKTILPSLHFDNPNPRIKWDEIGLKIPIEPIAWPSDKPLIAGVNTFGITGTNAHAIVAAAPQQQTASPAEPLRRDILILPLAAKSEQALCQLAARYAAFIESSVQPLESICAMAALRRTHHAMREVFVAASKSELIEQLRDFAENNNYESQQAFDAEDAKQIVFVFPGQGAQWAEMGRSLLENELVFRSTMEDIAAVYRKYVSWDLIEEISRPPEESRLEAIDIVQPVLVAVEIALASLWMSKGIFPDIVVGHSMGEVAAAYVAGHISIAEAARIIISRSLLMKTQSGKGEMGATDLTESEAAEYLNGFEDKLSVAVRNSRTSTVLSGDPEALSAVFAKLEAAGRFNRKVKVDVASHSPQMDPIRPELECILSDLQPVNAGIRMYSTALDQWVEGTQLTADYWSKNLRQPVQFGSAIRHIAERYHAVFIEMSPHATLLHAIRENVAECDNKAVVLGSFSRNRNEQADFYRNLAALHSTHAGFDWHTIYPDIAEFVELPTYAWQKERYWIDAAPAYTVPVVPATPKAGAIGNYVPVWKPEAFDAAPEAKQVLLIRDTDERYRIIQSRLIAAGCMVTVKAMDDDLEGIRPDLVIHLRSVYTDSPFNFYLDCGVLSIQRLLNYFSASGQNPKLCLLTNGAQSVNPSDTEMNLNASILWGLNRVLQHEYPSFDFLAIDLPFRPEDADLERAAELVFADHTWKELAIRNDQVFAAQLQPYMKTGGSARTALPAGKSCLITGGTGGLGLELAGWLHTNGVSHIALVSRNGANASTEKFISEHPELDVRVFKADIGDADQTAQLVRAIENEMPEIGGVFHAAGILDDGTFDHLSREQFERVMRPKVQGAWNLHQALQARDLSCFVLFSSVAGILGISAQANYAGANSFLDALAHYRRNNGLPATAIDYGTVAEIGLAAAESIRGDRLKDQGLVPVSPAALSQAWDLVLTDDPVQFIFADLDLEKWAAANERTKQNRFYANVIRAEQDQAAKTKDAYSWRNLKEARKFITEELKARVSAITKIPLSKMREDSTFKQMGIDSLMALQLKNKLQEAFGLNLNVSSIWSHPTIEKYQEYLAEALKLPEHYEKQEPAPAPTLPKTIEQEVESLSLDDLMKELSKKLDT